MSSLMEVVAENYVISQADQNQARFNVTAEQQGKVLSPVVTISFREPNQNEKALTDVKDKVIEFYNLIKANPYLQIIAFALVMIAIIGFFMLLQHAANSAKKTA